MEKEFFQRKELIGKLVVDQEANKVGKIKDLALTKKGEIGLLLNGEGEEANLIMLDDVQKIGDVVLLKPQVVKEVMPPVTTPPPKKEPPKPKVEKPVERPRVTVANACPNCSWVNKPKAKFCVKCGTTLA